MHSSQNEQDSRTLAAASKVAMLEPSDSQECKDFVKMAFDISEEFDTPVMLRLSTRISHSQSLVEVGEREERPRKEYVKNPGKYVMMPAMAKARHVVVEERLIRLTALSETLVKEEINSDKIGVIACGVAYQYAKEALGNQVSYLKLNMVNPLPVDVLKTFAAKHEKVYVIEELEPVIEKHCRALGLDVIGKEVFTLLGEYTAPMVAKAILGKESVDLIEVEEQTPVRPPVMCPGCPHRGMFYVLKSLASR